MGEVCNNLFINTWKKDGDPRDSSIGLHVGPGCATDCENCPPDSSECYDEELSNRLGKTFVVVHNNVCDKNQGPGILIHSDATWVTLYGNIVSRSCSIFGTSQEPCAGIEARDNQVPPQKPDQYSSYRNLLWFNKNANQAYVDYLPDEVGNTMKGQNDKNHETGENHPRFEGVIGSPSSGDYSFMLQHDEDDDNECYQKTNYLSEGIDEGPEQELYYDQQPPGLQTHRCDIGAYGGPRARWGSESEPCKEYLGLPPFTECN